jgi:hypothetical protein
MIGYQAVICCTKLHSGDGLMETEETDTDCGYQACAFGGY